MPEPHPGPQPQIMEGVIVDNTAQLNQAWLPPKPDGYSMEVIYRTMNKVCFMKSYQGNEHKSMLCQFVTHDKTKQSHLKIQRNGTNMLVAEGATLRCEKKRCETNCQQSITATIICC